MFVRIEKAGTEYADIIGQVHSEAWQQTYAGVFPESFLREDTAEKRKQEFLETLGNKDIFYYIVYEDTTPIGIVKVIEEPDAYEIASLYILEKYRNKGYGKQVIAYLQKELNPKRIRLWVLEENTKARRFYENNAFEFSGNTRLIHRGQAFTQLQYELLYHTQEESFMTNLIVKHNELTAEEFIFLWESAWGPSQTLEQTKLAMDHTLFRVSVFDGKQIVGMARVIGDMGLCYYIKDVVVLPEYQGKGIGRLLIDELLKFINANGVPDTHIWVELCAMPDKIPFYEKFGFSANEAQRLRIIYPVEK